ncbi:hypothetical protein [Streptomyces sp. TRM64462]|uniref:hypothetical protein n=1 Tax=Streptomyces sp. TRM64462 TaxID=2741726 RepID=UPI001586E05A|nr:hypothetical protein [Streptomyces sp. TRM64462]
MAYFLIAFFALGSAFMTWKASRLWRNPALVEEFMLTFAFLPFGPDVKRGEVRSVGITAVSLWAITTLIVQASLETEETGASMAVFLVSMVTLLLCLLAEVAVVLFNAPKAIVPPHMRDDLGVIAARRARRRGRREA